MYSSGPPHMQKQDDQLEPTFSSPVRIRDVALTTCQKRWTIGRSGERGLGISVLAAWHDDDDDDDDDENLNRFNFRLLARILRIGFLFLLIGIGKCSYDMLNRTILYSTDTHTQLYHTFTHRLHKCIYTHTHTKRVHKYTHTHEHTHKVCSERGK